MAKYTAEYTATFEETVREFTTEGKTKKMLKKAIFFILEEPYVNARKIKEYSGESLFRKNICGGRLRIFYRVDRKNKRITFYFLRRKDKGTYKNL